MEIRNAGINFSEQLVADLLKSKHIWVNEGSMYGQAGEGFIRINIACPRQVLTEGLLPYAPSVG